MHTSLVTVAITSEVKLEFTINEADVKIEWYSGTGCGGQHKNKHQNSCRLTHLPTGVVSTAQTRSRENSYKLAFDSLKTKVEEAGNASISNKAAELRSKQIGTGQRGEKIRTYSLQHGIVKDHRTDRQVAVDLILKSGKFDLFH